MVKTSTPSALDTHLGYWLRSLSNGVSSRFQMLLQAEECSVTDWVALRTLFERPETSHAELISALGMTKGAASKIVSRLEERGLLRRQWVKGSAREQLLKLTPKGREVVPRLASLADQNESHFFGHLPERDREELMAIVQSLVSHHELTSPPLN